MADNNIRQIFSQTLQILKDHPNQFVEFGLQMGQNDIYTAERYWFTIVLNDTPYTVGEQDLDGWNSADDAKRARGEKN